MKFMMITDPWCDNQSLIQRFGATLFRQGDRKALLADLIINGRWNRPEFIPETVFNVIQRINIVAGLDTIGWKNGSFNLKQALNSCRYITPTVNWWDLCWKHCRPRIAIGVCIILHNKNLSFVNLQKRGITLAAICHNCMRNVDSNDLIFCTCSYAQKVWCEIFSLLRIDNPGCNSLMQLVEWFGLQTNSTSTKSKVLSSVFSTVIWKIWAIRNDVLHNGVQIQTNFAAQSIIWEVLTHLKIRLEDLLLIF
ncbi:uncharacterized protein LOC132301763 [Cornus florida]|uniref:uncharacterized protein LOC132301763 n=1 Tax=Cornus florida TaxID=4283 RepID=UPI002896804F|nr:uncharacterized protein LOC132301763 [Cornus florida]